MRDWLAERARTHGADLALCGDEPLSFAALAAAAAEADARLNACGLQRGDRVALLLHNRPELIALVHAVPRRGRVLVPLGVRLTAAELAAQLAAADCRLLLYEEATRATVAALRSTSSVPGVCIDDDPLPGDARWRDFAGAPGDEAPALDLDRLHTILFTSGSSGRAKGVLLTWGNHYGNAVGSALNLGVRGDDCWLACLPMNHVGGLSILLRSVVSGFAVCLQPRFDPVLANRAIDRGGVTLVSVVADMLGRLLAARDHRPFPPSLRGVLLGGGPAPAALLDACRALGAPILSTYGMTESASQIATASPRAPDTGLRVLRGAELRIADSSGRSCPAGVEGRIEVRGEIVSPGYLGAATRRRGDWFDTGDVGRLDGEGALHVLGRDDDTIISGGENIHPREIERVLETHPGVAEVCAFGIADPRWGQSPMACVRLHPGCDTSEAALREHCSNHLARFKIPRRIALVADFPRTTSGKIARRALAESHAGSGAGTPVRP